MSKSLQRSLPPMELRQPDRADRPQSGNRTLPDIPLEMAKAGIGRAVRDAIGDDPMKVYGDDSMMAKVIAGEKVPDYLARIYRNPDARRRYALALLKSDPNVRITTNVAWDEEKVG